MLYKSKFYLNTLSSSGVIAKIVQGRFAHSSHVYNLLIYIYIYIYIYLTENDKIF